MAQVPTPPVSRSLAGLLLQPLLLPALLLLLVLVILNSSVQHMARNTDLVTASQQRLTLLRQMLFDVSGMENSERGYVITGQMRFLDSYRQSQADFRHHVTDYQGRIITQRQRDNLTRLLSSMEDWEKNAAIPEMTARQQSLDSAVERVSSGVGATHTLQAKETLTNMIGFENTRLTEATTSSRALLNRARLLVPLSLVVALLLLWWAGRRVLKLLSQNVSALTEGTRRIASGEYGHRVAPLRVRELDVLSAQFHEMAGAVAEREQQLQAQQVTLEQANKQLQQANQGLERSNRELERFAYVASHDLQEPLRTIGSYTELLARRYQGQLDERADKYIEFTMTATHRLKALIQDLLVFSRVQRASRKAEQVNLNALLENIRQELESRLTETGGALRVEALPTVTANPELLHHIFLNLLGNALKFRAPGRPPEVRVWAERQPAEWVIHVQDNGIGIEEQYHARIFEAFQRLHPTSEYEGSGIGLSVMRSAVEQHGGRVWVQSVPGQGSTFSFTLPDTSPLVLPDQVGEETLSSN